ncbi:hypothetical protein M885DRAFT_559189 [Pelagophyceae sp. CCMP2097]|nr:hypothetical protein M885DRAFT_559189 [Pelagophyceae sp. CCMP2097]
MAEVVRLVDAEARLRRARRRGLVQSERLPSVRVRSASFAHAPRPCLRPGPQPHAHLPGHEAQPGPGYYGNSDRAVMGQKNRTFDCQPSFDSPALSGQLGSPMSEGRSALTDRACSLRNRIAKLADAEDSKGTARASTPLIDARRKRASAEYAQARRLLAQLDAIEQTASPNAAASSASFAFTSRWAGGLTHTSSKFGSTMTLATRPCSVPLNLTQDRFYDQFENTTKTPGPGSYNWSNANITT